MDSLICKGKHLSSCMCLHVFVYEKLSEFNVLLVKEHPVE